MRSWLLAVIGLDVVLVGVAVLRYPPLLVQPGSALAKNVVGTVTARDTWTGALAALVDRRAQLANGLLFAPAADGTELESLLASAQALVDAEPETTAWFAVKLGPSEFGSSTSSRATRAGRLTSTGRSPRR